MSQHTARVVWQRAADEAFTDQRYSRRHLLHFDGGAQIAGSASPQNVPRGCADPAAVDPEEAYIAALAACHMLWFLSLAAARGWVVDAYDDAAEGALARNEEGRTAITVVTLRPTVRFGGTGRPTRDEVEALHHAAHDACFIAQSVKSEVRCEPVWISD